MRMALIGVAVLAVVAGIVVFMMQGKSGTGSPAATTSGPDTQTIESPPPGPPAIRGPDAEALARLREEISRAEPVSFVTDEERMASARAWVDANRPADRPYNDLEARMLALMDMVFDGQERSALWTLNMQEIEVEMIRAIDADGDGQVTDEEVAAFADAGFGMFDPTQHPYLQERLDTDGDGTLSQAELEQLASTDFMGGAMKGVMERARLEAWDTDNNGSLSDDERVAGESAQGSMLKFFADGHVEPVTDPSEIDPAEQEQVLAQLREDFGDGYADQMRAQADITNGMAVAMPLLQDMRVENMDQQELQKQIMQSMPTPPAQDQFDIDGDGQVTGTEVETMTAAMQEYQEHIRDWAAVQQASALRLMFDHATSQSDQDSDGRMSAEEWDDRIDQLMHEREERLFLRSYDLNGSGRIEGAELNQYVEWYQAQSLRADVNYDGAVDARDLETMAIRFQQQGR